MKVFITLQKMLNFLYVFRLTTVVLRLDSGASDSGLSPGRGHCVVFLSKTLTLREPLSTQVYKWVPANCWGSLTNCGGVTCHGLASCPGEVEILLGASC